MILYAIALELTVILAFWLCLAALQRHRSTPGRWAFVALAVSIATWCLGLIVEHRGLVGVVGGDRIAYAGAMALPVAWLGLAARTGRLVVASRVPWLPAVLLAPSLVLYGLLYAGPWGAIFLSYGADGTPVPGPLWWISAAYAWILCAAGSVIFVVTALGWRAPGNRARRMALGIASLAPVASNTAYLLTGMTWPVDPTPLLLGLVLVAMHAALFSGGLLAILPVSQHDLIDRLPHGIILTDPSETVVGMNRAAENLLSIASSEASGRTLEAVLPDPEELDVQSIPIGEGRAFAGHIMLIQAAVKKNRPIDS